MLKEISAFRKLGKKVEEMKMHTVDWSVTSRTNCRLDIWSLHLKNQLMQRSKISPSSIARSTETKFSASTMSGSHAEAT